MNDIGRVEEALASHDRALALDPNNAQTWSNRGAALVSLKRLQEALDSHHKALSLNPQLAEAWARAGSVLNELKERERAYEYLEKALALDPNIPHLFGEWLQVKMQMCQWGGASGAASMMFWILGGNPLLRMLI